MTELVTNVLLVLGGLFTLLAGIGFIRMPDLYTRMQAAGMAGTLGVSCLLLAVGVYFSQVIVWIKVLLVIAVIFSTVPAAAQLIARSAYMSGVKIWGGTIRDDLKSKV